MLLTLQTRSLGDIAIVRCAGRVVAGAEAQHLEDELRKLSTDWRAFVLELSGVTHIDSTGLGLLVRLLARARSAGGDLKLAAPPPHIHRMFELTKLSTVLEVHGSEPDAVRALFQKPLRPAAGPFGAARRVLFLHRSLDLCAFARTLLSNHGFSVISTDNLPDAKVMLKAGKADVIVLGRLPAAPAGSVRSTLGTLAPQASIVELDADFESLDATDAGRLLLQMAS